MSNLCLVTGANGHLGNNLVRALIAKGERVRAGVRDVSNHQAFTGLDCELVYTELQDKNSLIKALEGVDILYQVAAVFKHWAKNPEAEIVTPNVEGTRNILEAAAQAGIKKIVYVSSVAAVGHNGEALDEVQWNTDQSNPYYRSKILSERLAWEIAKELGLHMVAVLPSAMIGPHAFRLTDTMDYIESIRQRQVPLNPNFHFNFVDVRDVANAVIMAAQCGVAGERYILANTHSSGLDSIIAAANSVTRGYKLPPRAPKWLLYLAASLKEIMAKLTGKAANLTRSQVDTFYGIKQEYSIKKASAQFGFQPRTPEAALKETFKYLMERGLPVNLSKGGS